MPDDQIVASSATPAPEPTPDVLSPADQAVADQDVSAFRAIRRAERANQPAPTKPSAAAADQPAEQAGERPEPSPASEPGKPASTGHKGNADTRIQELLAERASLRRELESLRQPAPTPSQPTAPAAVTPANPDPEPKLEDFEADPEKYPDPYAAFLKAQAKWEYRQERAKERAEETERLARERDDAAEAEVVGAFAKRLEEAVAADPAFLESLSADVRGFQTVKQAHVANEARAAQGLPPIRLTPRHAIASEVVESPLAVDLMRHLSAHPEELTALERAKGPRELLRAFGALEERVRAASVKADPAPVRVVSAAPPPPAKVGIPTSEPVDEADAAVRNRDVAAFRAARDRERMRKAQR